MTAEQIFKSINLKPLLSNFSNLEEEFRYRVLDYELETTDNEMFFIDVHVAVDCKHNYLDNSIDIVYKNVYVSVAQEYFTCDRYGGEVEELLDEDTALDLGKLIEEAICDCF